MSCETGRRRLSRRNGHRFRRRREPRAGLSPTVGDALGRVLDHEVAGRSSQSRTRRYTRTERKDGVPWVRRDGAGCRVYARGPTITPACDHYLVRRLSPTDTADRTLSLAGIDDPESIATDAESETTRPLSQYGENDRALLPEFGHVMTPTGCYRVRVLTG